MRRWPRTLATLVFAMLGLAVQAQPRLEASFRDPVQTVRPDETIEVWLSLANTGETALTFNLGSAEPPFGLPPELPLPTTGYNLGNPDLPYFQDFGSYTGISLYTFQACDDDFAPGCSPGSHSWQPSFVNNWFDVGSPYTLAAGSSQDFLLYRLVPVGGNAPAGVYQAFNIGVGMSVHGLAVDGITPLEAPVFEVGTCSNGDPGCAFTVTVVPEPASALLMLAGLLPLGVAARRRWRGPGPAPR